MHDCQGGFQALVLQVEVELAELRGGEHALVHHGAGGQGREVHRVAAGTGTRAAAAQLALGALADEPCAAVQLEALEGLAVLVVAGHEELVEQRLGIAGDGAQGGIVDRHIAPADELQPFFLNNLLDIADGLEGRHARVREEGNTGGVLTCGRQLDALSSHFLAVEAVRDLNKDARAVAGVLLGTCGAAVIQIDQCLDALIHNVSAGAAMHVHHKGDTTRIMLELRIIETLACWVVIHDLWPYSRHKNSSVVYMQIILP